jgi:hypothetical protein
MKCALSGRSVRATSTSYPRCAASRSVSPVRATQKSKTLQTALPSTAGEPVFNAADVIGRHAALLILSQSIPAG